MKPLASLSRLRIAGLTLTDLVVAAAITSVLAAGMFTTISVLQRTANASNHHARSQLQQARLLDYMSRDLRRALTVSVDTFNGAERLNVTIPDYYETTGAARDPAIVLGGINYGTSTGIAISYFKDGDKVFRSVAGVRTALATDVTDFKIDYTDSGEQAVSVSVNFVPRYQFKAQDTINIRDGTAVFATTLLRNKRQ